MPVTLKKKLIEVSLPLDAINAAAAREKSIRHGHPSTLHLWWARRPLAAARAVIFAQMVDDPSGYVDELLGDNKLKRKAESRRKARHKVWSEAQALYEKAQHTTANMPEPGPEPTLEEALADLERERLFAIIEELVKWENTNNEEVLDKARDEIWQSWRRACAENADHPQASELFDRHKLPAFHDPFAGGGAIPLEAQRLGLESHASDLNPVAVMINKAMIEIPPRFANCPPVNPEAQANAANSGSWKGATGLAEDVRHYGQWMRDEAEKRIGHLYPKVEITDEMVAKRPDLKPYLGQQLTVIAWLWARTVKSPNPAFSNVDVPLASSFVLSSKKGKEVWVEPIVEGDRYRFVVRIGKPPVHAKTGTKVGRGGNFKCLVSETPIPVAEIRRQGQSGTFKQRLMAVVAEGIRGRVYLSPTSEMEAVANSAEPDWVPDTEINHNPRDIRTQLYGLTSYGDLFTSRQLVALSTFSDLVAEVRAQVVEDAQAAGMDEDSLGLDGGGCGAMAYGEAVGVYSSFTISKLIDINNSLAPWGAIQQCPLHLFSRQAIPMVWDFAEANPLSNSSGSWKTVMKGIQMGMKEVVCSSHQRTFAFSLQSDAGNQLISGYKVVSTDPPYYDNIGYADLSDFFYVWMRRSLRSTYPSLFATMTVPKAEELVATPYRHSNREKAETFFMGGMTRAIHNLAEQAHPVFPVTIYYAFKQSETRDSTGTTNTGWDTFLEAVIQAGFSIDGTWPMRTERNARMVGQGTNALASSIVLVCRARPANTPDATRREFLNRLKSELPDALAKLQAGNIAPVDLAQAAIGPGMAVFSRYGRVVDAEGKPLSVRTALALINQVLDEVLTEQEGDFDADSRFALAWFEQHGFEESIFGEADVLARAKGTSVDGVTEAGILRSGQGKVRILEPNELPDNWEPATDRRLTVWEMVHHLIRVLESGGEPAAAELVVKLGSRAETARELCYRLYTVCERKNRAADAIAYNSLVQSWPEISRLAQDVTSTTPTTRDLFE